MTTIRLYGKLARLFAKRIDLRVTSPKEAISALEANYPGFRQYILGRSMHIFISGIGNISNEDMHLNTGSRTIKIAPVHKGSDKVFNIIIATFLNPFAVIFVASALAYQSILEMLFAPPELGNTQDIAKEPSYSFNGAINTVAQGYPVPVGYGRVLVGSAVIGAGIHTQAI